MISKREKLLVAAGAGAAVILFAIIMLVGNYTECGLLRTLSGPDSSPRYAAAALKEAGGSPRASRAMAMAESAADSAENISQDERKLVKTGNISIEVKDYDSSVKAIDAMLKEFDGFILRSSKYVSDDNKAVGDISVKVKPENFDSFVSRLDSLGRVKSKNSYINDVTEQYIDLESRLNSSLRVEKRLREILTIKTKNVKDILEVEKELTRVGENIERLKGRKKYLDNRIGMAELTIHIAEEKNIVTGSYKFFERIRQAFRGAVNAFIGITSGLIIAIGAALALSVYGILFFLLLAGIKKFRKK
ncbi:MAG: hypothetical protein COS41_06215 [Elusimicrobia bacterium CG03_land_8_20_14_0_80_50_18]|nr:MAG: hypothetical protein COS41_06215 [Elusimicrobia bacterium CG03_land_8_20_14_0_80_50_18]PIX16288.1 MAG: hypothetical protein COZ72_01375 [Elusimicrobia bacterium CG_4_8_14_3_um_filter_50_9]